MVIVIEGAHRLPGGRRPGSRLGRGCLCGFPGRVPMAVCEPSARSRAVFITRLVIPGGMGLARLTDGHPDWPASGLARERSPSWVQQRERVHPQYRRDAALFDDGRSAAEPGVLRHARAVARQQKCALIAMWIQTARPTATTPPHPGSDGRQDGWRSTRLRVPLPVPPTPRSRPGPALFGDLPSGPFPVAGVAPVRPRLVALDTVNRGCSLGGLLDA